MYYMYAVTHTHVARPARKHPAAPSYMCPLLHPLFISASSPAFAALIMAMFLSGVPQLGFAPTFPVISPMTTRPAALMSAADKL